MSQQLTEPEIRTYRGRTLAELIPRIREELGPDAVILREREGLVGGLGGFFAQRCIEVDARASGPTISVYDDDEDEELEREFEPRPVAEPEPGFAAALEAEIAAAVQAHEQFDDPGPELDADEIIPPPELVLAAPPESEPAAPITEPAPPIGEPAPPIGETAPPPELEFAAPPAPEPAPAAPQRAARPALRRPVRRRRPQPRRELDRAAGTEVMRTLCERGISDGWAADLLVQGAAHAAPFAAPGDLRGAVRDQLARNLQLAPALPRAGAAIGFVGTGGSGKTSCVAALAAAYARASTLPVCAVTIASRDRGAELTELLKPHGVQVAAFPTARAAAKLIATRRRTGLVLVDTAAPRIGDVAAIAEFAAELRELALDLTCVTLPVTLGAQSARRLLSAMQPTGYGALALTHLDETDQLGPALEISASCDLPIAYVNEGAEIAGSISAPSPALLAARLL